MGTSKNFKILFFVVLILSLGAAGFFLLFYRLFQNDVNELTDFSTAYKQFDQAISAYSSSVLTSNLQSGPAAGALEQQADKALAGLQSKASVRISSLTKHDAELMSLTLEIGNLAQKELDDLKAYQSAAAGNNSKADQLSKEIAGLTSQRQAAYNHFKELLGINP